jgi:hypothetical protein
MGNNLKKWAATGALASVFGFAATYTPEQEMTGKIIAVEAVGNESNFQILEIGLLTGHKKDGSWILSHFDVSNLNLRPGIDMPDNVVDQTSYKITTRESLLHRGARYMLRIDDQYSPPKAEKFERVSPPSQ